MATSLSYKLTKELVAGVKKPSVAWQVENYEPTHTPISTTHVETALVLVKLNTIAKQPDGGNESLYVYGKDGSDSYKITL